MDTANNIEVISSSPSGSASKSTSSHRVVVKVTLKKNPKGRNWRLPNSVYRVQKDACRRAREMGDAAETVQVDEQKRVQCPACTRTFRYRCQVVQHCITHTREKPYRCIVPACDMWMRWRSTVFYHAHMHILKGDIKLVDDVGPVSIFKKDDENVRNEPSLDDLEEPEQDAVPASRPS